MADLYLGTYAEINVFHARQGVEVVPELRFGEHHQLSVTVSFLSTPEINEAREGASLVGKSDAPYTGQLHAMVSMSIVVALEVALVEHLYGIGLGEIGRMTVPGGTQQGCMLETTRTVETAVLLYMGSKG